MYAKYRYTFYLDSGGIYITSTTFKLCIAFDRPSAAMLPHRGSCFKWFDHVDLGLECCVCVHFHFAIIFLKFSIILNLKTLQTKTKVFSIGGCVTLTDLMGIFKTRAAMAGDNGNFNELKKYLYRVASSPIRNVSCVYCLLVIWWCAICQQLAESTIFNPLYHVIWRVDTKQHDNRLK